MSKSSLAKIAGETADSLRGTHLFETVKVSAVSSGSQIFEELESMTRLPGALVAISRADFAEEGLERNLHLLLIVADRFRLGAAAKNAGVWDLLEAIETLAEKSVCPCGIPFTLDGWEAIDAGKESITAFALRLSGAEA